MFDCWIFLYVLTLCHRCVNTQLQYMYVSFQNRIRWMPIEYRTYSSCMVIHSMCHNYISLHHCSTTTLPVTDLSCPSIDRFDANTPAIRNNAEPIHVGRQHFYVIPSGITSCSDRMHVRLITTSASQSPNESHEFCMHRDLVTCMHRAHVCMRYCISLYCTRVPFYLWTVKFYYPRTLSQNVYGSLFCVLSF